MAPVISSSFSFGHVASGSAGALITQDLQLHLDATQISGSDTDPLSQWDDQSGNAFHATQAGSNKPVYRTTETIGGNPTVEFTNTSNTWFQLPTGFTNMLPTGSGGAECFMVARAKLDPDAGAPGLWILHSGSGSFSITWPSSGSVLFMMFGSGGRPQIGDSDNFGGDRLTTAHLLNVSRTENGPLTARLWINGTRHINGTFGTNQSLSWATGTNHTIGSSRRNTGRDANSFWGEFLFYDRILSGSERDSNLAYLNSKWSLGGVPNP